MLNVRAFNSITDEALKCAWKKLELGKDMTAFQYYNWHMMLDIEFKQNWLKRLFGTVKYYVLYSDSDPVLIAPLYIQRYTVTIKNFGYEKGIFFLGTKGYSDYLNFIYRDVTVDEISYFIKFISNDTGIHDMTFSQIMEESLMNCIFHEKMEEAQHVSEEACVKLQIPQSVEVLNQKMSKQFRQNYRTQKNHYKKDGFEMNIELIEGTVPTNIIRRIQDIHDDRFRKKNRHNNHVRFYSLIALFKPRFDEVGYALEHNDNNWLLLGKHNNKIISYMFGLKDHNAIRVMQMGFDSTYENRSPCITAFLDCLYQEFGMFANCVIDFTRGEEPYKYRMGGEKHLINQYHITV